jgi:hypothetical protein
MGIDRSFCPPGKKSLAHPNLNFKISKRRTWRKLVIGSNLALGRAVRKLLARFVGTGLGHRSGFRLARLFPKPVLSHKLSILPEMSPEISSGSPLDRLVLVDVPLETSECGYGIVGISWVSSSTGDLIVSSSAGDNFVGKLWGDVGFVSFRGWV